MASDSPDTAQFIAAAREQGASDEFIVALLKQRGFPERDIFAAFAGFYEHLTGLAVPNRGGKAEGARVAFLHLVMFTALGIWTVSLGSLLFGLINLYLPDPLLNSPSYSGQWARGRFAYQLAGIIVAFPVYLLVTRAILNGQRQQPERMDSGVRRWLTYIVLVITTIILLSDVVALLALFLRGDLTLRFVLKVILLFLIAGGVFLYYLGSLRSEATSSFRSRAFAYTAAGVVAATVAAGFFQVGTPADQRRSAADQRRVKDLFTIASSIGEQRRGTTTKLPESLEEMPVYRHLVQDATRKGEYDYRRKSDTRFQLCALFNTDNRDQRSRNAFWRHPAGRYCYEFDTTEQAWRYHPGDF